MSYYKGLETANSIQKTKHQLLSSAAPILDQIPRSLGLEEIIQESAHAYRDRLFAPLEILNLFLKQVLSADKSCKNILINSLSSRIAQGLSRHSTNSAAYCKARNRLPLSLIQTVSRRISNSIQVSAGNKWQECCLKIIDGTTVSMPDTEEDQSMFPQIPTQKTGLGFPIARVLALTCVVTGTLIDANIGSYTDSEYALYKGLSHQLKAGDILLADRYYCSYFMVAQLLMKNVGCVVKMHASREYDFNKGQVLGHDDHIVNWVKPKLKPAWVNQETYDACPNEITVREIKKNNTVLVTTLLDKKVHSKNQLLKLYKDRWHIELDIRVIKQVMQMDILRCKSPALIMKEIWIHILGYNLIRLLMAHAADVYGKKPRHLSFKAALQSINIYVETSQHCLELTKRRLYQELLFNLSRQVVGQRPGRKEPRAIKRRPKPHCLLKVPRQQWRDL